MKISQLIITVFFLLNISLLSSSIYYVDASKPNNSANGLSWINAKRDLQEAINSASSGDSIWVKQGTYFPTKDPFNNSSPSDNRDKTFFISKSLYLFGGFNGTESSLQSRNLLANNTILSGDIGTLGDSSDNTYHVMITTDALVSNTIIVIDGFTITKGWSNDFSNSLTISGRQFRKYYGMGIYANGGNTKIKNCKIQNNIGGNVGAGIYATKYTEIVNNMIMNNISKNNGGGIGCDACQITGNYIFNNGAEFGGGGIALFDTNGIVKNNVIYKNYGLVGGGIGIQEGSKGHKILNNTIVENKAYPGGITGGLYSLGDSIIINNNLFWNNKNDTSIYNPQSDLQCHIPYGKCSNNLLQNNNDTIFYPNFTATWINNIHKTTPNFLNVNSPLGFDGIFRTSDDGFRLTSTSVAINSGTNSISNPIDILDSIRNGNYDIGAYEFKSICPYKVDSINASICVGDSLLFNSIYRKNAGYYIDTLKTSNGCDSFIILNLKVKSLPVINITLSGSQLIATSGYSSYIWKLNNIIISGTTNIQNPISNGLYKVEIIDSNSCKNTTTFNYIGANILDFTNKSYQLFPNPTTGIININGGKNKKHNISIYNLDGKLVKEIAEIDKFDITRLSNGIYIIVIGNNTFKIKLEK